MYKVLAIYVVTLHASSLASYRPCPAAAAAAASSKVRCHFAAATIAATVVVFLPR